jgi:hypothetical protein
LPSGDGFIVALGIDSFVKNLHPDPFLGLAGGPFFAAAASGR